MKHFLITGVLFLSLLASQAQDTLHMRDGRVREGTIVEVTEQNIRYIPANHTENRIFTILLEAVEKITYADGTVHYLHPPELPTHPPELPSTTNEELADRFAAVNHVSFSLIGITYRGSLSLAYERVFRSGDIAVKIPFSVGFIENDIYSFYEGQSLYRSGLGIHSYRTRRGLSKTFRGGELFAGSYKYFPDVIDSSIRATARYFGANVYYGLMVYPGKNFGISGQLGIGMARSDQFKRYSFIMPLDFNLVFRF